MNVLTEVETKKMAEKAFGHAEGRILAGEYSSINIGDIWMVWQRRPKRDGGTLKRKGAWGHLRYWSGMELYGEPLTREQAIRLTTFNWSTPVEIRKVMADAQLQMVCTICGGVGQGAAQLHTWGCLGEIQDWRIRFGGDWWDEPWGDPLAICDGCTSKIRRGLIGRIG